MSPAPDNRQCEVAGSQAASTINVTVVRSNFTNSLIAHSAVGLKTLGVLLVFGQFHVKIEAHMKRILFFSWLLVALSVQAAGKQSRPNILFAFADDWGRYASAYAKVDGRPSPNDVIKTPHFDRVAREGVLLRTPL